jgi:hypothetical protein
VLGENIFISAEPKTIPLIFNEESKPIPEIKLEEGGKTENQQSSAISQDALLIPCPQCKAQGKLRLFCSDVDLATHMEIHRKD